MSKSVLLSIKPKYCELIASGKKTIEVRKTKPKLDTPFKVYIYETKALYKPNGCNHLFKGEGKVIGEFVCKAILPISITYSDPNSKIALREFPYTCLTDKEIMDYLGNGKTGYGLPISDLVIYDKPKELRDFSSGSSRLTWDDNGNWVWSGMKRPPQSWCYVEEL